MMCGVCVVATYLTEGLQSFDSVVERRCPHSALVLLLWSLFGRGGDLMLSTTGNSAHLIDGLKGCTTCPSEVIGSFWEKVGELACRSAIDCRDFLRSSVF